MANFSSPMTPSWRPQALLPIKFSSFFFNDTATTEIYTLSLHDALPISELGRDHEAARGMLLRVPHHPLGDRKSTRLNSSHPSISYAVFCLKKKQAEDLIEHAGDHRAVHVSGRTVVPVAYVDPAYHEPVVGDLDLVGFFF